MLRRMMSASVVFSDRVELGPEKCALVPEAVAVAQPLELVGDDRAASVGPTLPPGDVVLGQRADPEVDVVDLP